MGKPREWYWGVCKDSGIMTVIHDPKDLDKLIDPIHVLEVIPEPASDEDFNGCKTGDCPHEKQSECDKYAAELKSREQVECDICYKIHKNDQYYCETTGGWERLESKPSDEVLEAAAIKHEQECFIMEPWVETTPSRSFKAGHSHGKDYQATIIEANTFRDILAAFGGGDFIPIEFVRIMARRRGIKL